MLRLSVEIAGEVTRYPLQPGEILVGRIKTSDVFIDDSSISRRHARFQVTDDRCVLTDLGSSNGTYCNDELIKKCDVHGGDCLIFGGVAAWVEETIDERLALSTASRAPLSFVSRTAAQRPFQASFLAMRSSASMAIRWHPCRNLIHGCRRCQSGQR